MSTLDIRFVRVGNLKQYTLEKVEQEIAEGKLGIARDRLNGLIHAYPQDFTLRSRLGDVYFKLGYPREAGRFWFLDTDPNQEKLDAISLFIKECGGDPSKILHRLKLRFHPDELRETDVRRKIEDLVAECKRRGLPPPTFPAKSPAAPQSSNWLGMGCAILSFVCLGLILLGLWTLVTWLANPR